LACEVGTVGRMRLGGLYWVGGDVVVMGGRVEAG